MFPAYDELREGFFDAPHDFSPSLIHQIPVTGYGGLIESYNSSSLSERYFLSLSSFSGYSHTR